jgi:hypothetical protein
MLEIGDRERQWIGKIVAATSNDTACFLAFETAFSGSHSNKIPTCPVAADAHIAVDGTG